MEKKPYNSGKYGDAYWIKTTPQEAEDTAKQLETIDPKMSLAYKQYAKQISGGGSSSKNKSSVQPNMSLASGGEAFAMAPETTSPNMSTPKPNMSLASGGEAFALAPSTPKFRDTIKPYDPRNNAVTAAPKSGNIEIPLPFLPTTKKSVTIPGTSKINRAFQAFGTGFMNPGAGDSNRLKDNTKDFYGDLSGLGGLTSGAFQFAIAGGAATQAPKVVPLLAQTYLVTKTAQVGKDALILGTSASSINDYKDPNFKPMLKIARAKEYAADKEMTGLKGFLTDVSAGIYRPNEKVFVDSLKEQGATFNQINLAGRMREGDKLVGGYMIARISTQSEVLGRAGTSIKYALGNVATTSKSKLGTELFKNAAPSLFKAGMFEGAAIYQTDAILGGSRPTYKGYVTSGLAGGASATLIGGAIIKTGVSSPKVSKFIQGGAYASDPFEYVGDYFANKMSRYAYRTKAILPRVPIVTMTGNTYTLTNSQQNIIDNYFQATKTNSISTNTNINTVLNVKSNTPVNVYSFTKTKSFMNTPTKINDILRTNPRINTPVNIPTNTNTNINTNLIIPTNTNTNTNIPALINTPVNVPINTPVNVPINTVIPTFTPQRWAPVGLPRTGAPPKFSFSFLRNKKRPYKYAASLTAGLFNIRKGKRSNLTGLEVRPI